MAAPQIMLYEAHDCWKCVDVRELLDHLGLPYETVQVRGNPAARERMREAMGEPVSVPMLVDGDLAVWDRRRIIAHLRDRYGGPVEGSEQDRLPDWMGGSCTLDGDCEPEPGAAPPGRVG